MATPTKFEITLSFKAVMDGLNQYVSAYQRRMAEVQAFNARIMNGTAALQQIVVNAGAVLGGASVGQALTQMTRSGVEFNVQLEQAQLGIAAVLRQFDQAGKFKRFDDALAESGKAIDLLKAKAVTSPASFASLVMAFQATVGPMTAAGIKLRDQVNLIVNMSQALAGLGIAESQILQETRALITGNINADAAAAKILGITAADISSARQKGQLYEFLTSKISAFAEAGARGANTLATLRANLGDAAQQRSAAATLNLTEALRRLYATLTEFVQTPAFTGFLQVLADKVQGVVNLVDRLAGALAGVDPSLLLAVLDTVGDLASVVLAGAVAFGLYTAASKGLLLVMAPLRAAFVLLAGMSFLELNNILAAMTAGMSRTATVSYILADGMTTLAGAGRLAAISLAAVGAAVAGFLIGRTILDAMERSTLARLEAENQVRQAAADQTKQFTEQLRLIRSITEARNTAAQIEAALTKAVAERDTIQKRVDLANRVREATKNDPYAAVAVASTAAKNAQDQQRLADLEREIFDLSQRYRLAVDPNFVQGRIAANTTADTAARRNLTPEERRAREELEQKRALFELETQIREAALDGNVSLQERLTAERDQLQLLGELGQDAYEIVVNRLNLEAEERQRKRQEEARERAEELRNKQALFDLDTAILEAEADGNSPLAERLKREREELQLLADLGPQAYDLIQARLNATAELQARQTQRMQQEQDFSRRLGELDAERARIEASRFLTQDQKQRQVLPLLNEENRLIAERIALLEREAAGTGGQERLQIQARIDELRRQSADNAGATEAQQPLGFLGQLQADMTSFVDSFGTRMQTIANLVGAPLRAGIGALRNGMQGLLGDTTFWEQKLGRIGGPVMGALTGALSDMFARWIAGRASAAIASIGWAQKEGLAAKIAHMPGAILKSIESFGVAALVGTAAVIAAMSSFATGGMVRGPGTGTSDSIFARLSNGEFVARAAAVDRFGPAFFESLNAGVLDLAALPGGVARQAAGSASGSRSSGGSTAAASPAGTRPLLIIPVYDMQSALREAMRHPDYEVQIVDMMRRNRGQALDA